MFKHYVKVSILTLALVVCASTTAFGQTTQFTYQGKLTDSGNLANGQYDFQFKLFDTQTVGTGTQLGSVLVPNVTVTAGIFTVQLDFGACASCFNGSARFLEIAVKPTSGPTFTTLGSRQPVTSNPYAIRSLNAGNATTADGLSVACVSCVTSSQIGSVNGSALTGTIPLASVPSGSANYIQNTTSPQSSSNFNISGNGTAGGTVSANVVNAAMQYNIGPNRVLSAGGTANLFAGVGAGSVNTGSDNAFFGSDAGNFNTSGSGNAFFGWEAGNRNTTGSDNSFFGIQSGALNTTGFDNSFFGNGAGFDNSSGNSNAFFGISAGSSNSMGNANAFFGPAAGDNNTIGSINTAIGNGANVGANNLFNATAIGGNALVSQSNSLVLGSISGVNNASTNTSVGIGTTAPGAVLDVQRDGGTIPETVRFTTYGTDNEILSRATAGSRSTPAATPSGRALMLLSGGGHDGTNFVNNPRVSIAFDSTEAWTSTANGTRIRFRTTENGTASIATRVTIANDGNVGIGTLAPADLLHVMGIIRVATLGLGDTSNTLCRNSSNQIATCFSSSLRYKTDVQPFAGGLDIVRRLRPISFTWKQSGSRDVGFGAEDVARVEPLLTFTNEKGQIEGVKYDRINVALVNAVKEQQAEIEQQQAQIQQEQVQIQQEQSQIQQEQVQIKTQATAIQREEEEIKQQQLVINRLMKLVCADHRHAHICK